MLVATAFSSPIEIHALAGDEDLPALEALERAEQKLLGLSRHLTESKPQHIADIGTATFERYARLHEATDKTALYGLTTGFRDLDQLLTGLQPGSLTVVAGRPSHGKSSFALDVARHAAASLGKNVAVFSLEMTKQEIMDRIIAGFLNVETWRLKKGELTDADFRRLGTLFDQMKNHPIWIDDDPDTTIGNLRSKACGSRWSTDLICSSSTTCSSSRSPTAPRARTARSRSATFRGASRTWPASWERR